MATTVERVAAITATIHDGTSMIVLTKGKPVQVAESSIPYLDRHEALIAEDEEATAPAPAPTPAGAEPQPTTFAVGDDALAVPAGFTVTEKGGGWYEITGPDGFEPQKMRGIEHLREALAALAEDDTPPA